MGMPDESPFQDPTSGAPEPSGRPDSPSAPRPAPGRSGHFYLIHRHQTYSLREAARALDLPEGALRRAILLDQIKAHEVDDDRQYLLQGSDLREYLRDHRPSEPCVFPEEDSLLPDLLTFLIIPVLIVLVLLFVKNPEAPRPDRPAKQSVPADCVPGDPTGGSREQGSPGNRAPLEPDSGPGGSYFVLPNF